MAASDHFQRHLPGTELTLYDAARRAIPVLPDDEELEVPPGVLEELHCMICLDVMSDATAVAQCLHRFCSQCITKALRIKANCTDGSGNLHCPGCRHHMSSRRDVREDKLFNGLLEALSPEGEEEDGVEDVVDLTRARELTQGRSHHVSMVGPGRLMLPPSQLLVVFQLRPYSGGQGEAGSVVLPPVTKLMLRAPAEMTMSGLSWFVASRLQRVEPNNIEVLLLLDPSAIKNGNRVQDATPQVVVLDGRLRLREVVECFWTVTEELALYYRWKRKRSRTSQQQQAEDEEDGVDMEQ